MFEFLLAILVLTIIKSIFMKNILKVFFRGMIIAVIISLPQLPANGVITSLMLYGMLATVISYILTHIVMLTPYIKQELSVHFQWNVSSTVATALFTVFNACGAYLVNHLANPTTITLNAFIGVIWAAVVYAARTYALNSDNKFAVEPANKIQHPDTK